MTGLIGLAWLGCTDATDENPLDTDAEVIPETCPSFAAATQIGSVGNSTLTEISGLAVSRVHPGVLWVHNDSGDLPNVYAIDIGGDALGTWQLSGISATDWEDLVLGGDGDLFIGDIGDNGRSRASVRVHRLAEPDPLGTGEIVDFDTFVLTYPDGAHDAETLLFDAWTGELLIVTKETQGISKVFALDADSDPGKYELREVTEVTIGGLGLATGGDISERGHRILIRDYVGAQIWLRQADETLGEALSSTPCELDAIFEPQGEAIAFDAEGSYYTISEGNSQPITLYAIE